MYQALITRRYLLSKIMPLLAAAAVMLCTAMVLVVWSVMGGFLQMLLASGKSLMGDVSITWPELGIAHYQTLIDDLKKDPMVEAATPTIETLGILGMPSGDNNSVQVIGVEPEGYHAVTGYFDRLWWVPLERPLPKDKDRADPRLSRPSLVEELPGTQTAGRTLREPDLITGALRPAIVLGLEVSRPNNRRDRAGFVTPQWSFMPSREVTLSVPPRSQRGLVIDMATARFPVANEFRTGLYEADANWVIVPLDQLQKLMKMDKAQRVRDDAGAPVVEVGADGVERFVTPPVLAEEPARATNILIKAAPGVSPEALRKRCVGVYQAFAARYGAEVPPPDRIPIYTWENKPGLVTFIAAVKKETALVLVLFGFISMTSVFLVFAIFWSMISEKTKDIGVLRAIGAGRAGIAWLFLRYGLAIGAVGSLAGGALAYLVVLNINPIHEWLGTALGISVWDPAVYYFTEIPSKVEPWKAGMVLASGVLSSVVGALVPALRAAWMDPVRALRFE